jgi:ATP-dependent DNA ligase
MKSLEFDKLPGNSDRERYNYLLNRAAVTNCVYAQVKKNGIGVRLHVADGHGKPQIITRNGKPYPPNYFDAVIPTDAWRAISRLPYTTLHAELCSHNPQLPLATLAGGVSVNSETADPAIAESCYFYIYDVEAQDPHGSLPFKNRRDQLSLLSTNMHFAVASTVAYTSADDLINSWNHSFSGAFGPPPEGFVYRVDPCYHHDGSPTYMQVKRTQLKTAEGTCIAVEEGLGKRRGMLGSFTLQLDSGHLLSVGGGNGLTDEMLAYYLLHPPIGRRITFSYKELSNAGTPLRVQFVAVRDYE